MIAVLMILSPFILYYISNKIFIRVKFSSLEKNYWAKWAVLSYSEKEKLLYAENGWWLQRAKDDLVSSARSHEGKSDYHHVLDYHLSAERSIISKCPDFKKFSLLQTDIELKKIIRCESHGFSLTMDDYREHKAYLELLFERRNELSEVMLCELLKAKKIS